MKHLLNFLITGALIWMLGCSSYDDVNKIAENDKTLFQFIPVGQTQITAGVLKDRCDKNIQNLYMKINLDSLKQVFKKKHSHWYAEPEFVGHYLAAGPLLYQASGSSELLNNNKQVVDAVIAGQEPSGYLGTYKKGLEFDYTFSVWNQNFLIKGLIAQYEATGNEDALNAALKCADYIANAYLKSDTLDLLFGLNEGIQHATILEEISHLYRITGKKLYLEFAEYIIDRLENSSIQVLTIPNTVPFWAINYMMGCMKGIEMFNIYFGILEMYRITGDEQYLTASQNYWRNLQDKHIRLTGNGTIGEHWNAVGNNPVDLPNELHPNENCVAAGWMKFNAELAQFTGEAKYFDELEKTLYNHIFGSQAMDGSDFSYYQGNIGHKVHAKDPGAYSCCRYRGMRILAYLPGYIYMQSDNKIAVNLFENSETKTKIKDVAVQLAQKTEYPRNGKVQLSVLPEKEVAFELLIRKPNWCKKVTLTVDGKKQVINIQNGYMVIDQKWSNKKYLVELDFEMSVRFYDAEIGGQNRAAVKYGPLMLAIDSRFGTPIDRTEIQWSETPQLRKLSIADDAWLPQVKFKVKGKVNGRSKMITLVDYASAGSIHPGRDEFRLWIPVYE